MKKREHNSFLTPLVVEVMPSGKRFKLHYDFRYYWRRHGIWIHVKAGFETDFASIPKIFRIIIPKLGRWNKAAVIHDYLYQNHNIVICKLLPSTKFRFSRKLADLIFRDAMTDLGVAKWKRYVMYWGVRVGGFLAWRKR